MPIYYGYPLDEERYNKGSLINLFDNDIIFKKELFSEENRAKINETPLLNVDPVKWFLDVESEIMLKIKERL